MIQTPPDLPPTAVASERLSAAAPTLAAMPNVVLLGYPVSGRSRRNVRDQINAQRPDRDGQRHDAQTIWRYSSRWRGRSESVCLPETAVVTVEITVVMPDLETPERLSRDDLNAWRRYMVGLEHHEGNHVRIANHGAEEMQRAMRAASSCADMQAAAQRVSADVAAANVEYDRRTRHGETEGASF